MNKEQSDGIKANVFKGTGVDFEELTSMTAAAAVKVLRFRKNKAKYPWIVVKGGMVSGFFSLKVEAAGYPPPGQVLAGADEIVCFRGARASRPGFFDFKISKPREIRTDRITQYRELLATEARISDALYGTEQDCGWLARREVSVRVRPHEFLERLVRAGDTIPAMALAHAYLHNLACRPLYNAFEIFRVCDLLEREDPLSYTETILRALNYLNKKTIKLRGFKGAIGEARLVKLLWVDQQLDRRARKANSPLFVHQFHPATLALVL